jgi:hypothetical protein
MNKKSKKTLLKGTFLLLIMTPFLEINYADLLNFFIFLLISYIFLFFYIYYKSKQSILMMENDLLITAPLKRISIKYSDILRTFNRSGFLQRKFNLETIYIITRKINYAIRDIDSNAKLFDSIKEKIMINKII